MSAQQTAAAGQQPFAGSRTPEAARENPKPTKLTCYLREGRIWSMRVMNYYIECIRRTHCHNEDSRGRFHVFDLPDFTRFKKCEGNCSMLKSWLGTVNLFEKGYLILPISDSWMDWSLIFVCIPAKESNSGLIVLHLDPFNLHGGCIFLKKFIRYLEAEFLRLVENPAEISVSTTGDLSRNIETIAVCVPRQANDRERGFVMLYYIQRFMREAPERFTKDDMGMFKSWAGSKDEFWVFMEDINSLLESTRRRQVYERNIRDKYMYHGIRYRRHDPCSLYVPKRCEMYCLER